MSTLTFKNIILIRMIITGHFQRHHLQHELGFNQIGLTNSFWINPYFILGQIFLLLRPTNLIEISPILKSKIFSSKKELVDIILNSARKNPFWPSDLRRRVRVEDFCFSPIVHVSPIGSQYYLETSMVSSDHNETIARSTLIVYIH